MRKLICVLALVFCVGCTAKGTGGSFYYETAGGMSSLSYRVWREDGRTFFQTKANGGSVSLVDDPAEVDGAIWDELAQVVDKHKIGKWDGFDKDNFDVMDGSGFTLDCDIGGKRIRARGYERYPKDYEAGAAALGRVLAGYAARIAALMPPADAGDIAYVNVNALGFRVSVSFGRAITVYNPDYVPSTVLVIGENRPQYSFTFYHNGKNFTASENGWVFDEAAEADFRALVAGLDFRGGWPPEGAAAYVTAGLASVYGAEGSYYAPLTPEEERAVTEGIFRILGVSADSGWHVLFAD